MTAEPRFPVTITSSMLDSAERCSQLYFQQYVERWKFEGTSVHLVAGIAFAVGIAQARRSFYEQGKLLRTAWCDGLRAFLRSWSADDDGWPKKAIDDVYEALWSYLEVHPFDTDQLQPARLGPKRGIEFSFALELPIAHPTSGEPLLYSGRCDMLAQWGDVLFPTDEKTTAHLGDKWSSHFRLRGQFLGYVWAARRMGYDVAGVFVRGIGLRKDGPIFAQVPIYVPPFLVERWYMSMLNKTKGLVRMWKELQEYNTPPAYAFGFACTAYGGCHHAERCASQHPERLPGWEQVEKLYFEENVA